jgi:hypothetical protein
VEVTVNRAVDPAKLAAAHVDPAQVDAEAPAVEGDAPARNDDAEVAA